ncbi:export-related chaperone CsaA [Delftia acidovorans SPH-1]|uniref:Export-related chaperone CsaA n=1 Tax=Delftia acidovorans (strain DSM 14801 / SPH-1) TaxID=398578 RepID=A9BQH7_DELAS|nr:export-related chaperone CsaA [Delftia acidovorans SPH-1]
MTTSSALHETIGFDDFLKVELRVGRIVDAQVFKEARRPAYVLQVDFGPALGLRKSSAQITALYRPEELIGRQVVAVLNFPSKQIGPMRSECLVTGFHNEKARWRCACPTARCRWVPSCCDGLGDCWPG